MCYGIFLHLLQEMCQRTGRLNSAFSPLEHIHQLPARLLPICTVVNKSSCLVHSIMAAMRWAEGHSEGEEMWSAQARKKVVDLSDQRL